MLVVIHDYAGHPFQVELSRALSRRGYSVHHIFFAGDQGPKGEMKKKSGDGYIFFEPIGSSKSYSKTNFLKRRFSDLEYGKAVARRLAELSPDVVISGNTPTETQEIILNMCGSIGTKFIYWCQDFYSIAATSILKKKLFFFGVMVGKYYQHLEKRQMCRSEHIIHITERFCIQTDLWGIKRGKISIIPNWGALHDINVLTKNSNWSKRHGLDEKRKRALYSGTLGLKHNPTMLEKVALDNPDIEVVVVASGVGFDYLESRQTEIPNIKLLPLQPFSEFAEVLSSADILLAVIERDAGEFSVPSKILSYLCSGRAIVLAAPIDNLASVMVNDSKSGLVVESDDDEGFSKAVSSLIGDFCSRESSGINARNYAEKNFDIEKITDKFEKILVRIAS